MKVVERVRVLPPFDSFLFGFICLLFVAGLPILYSASYPEAIALKGDPNFFVVRQVVYGFLGMVCLLLVSVVNLEKLRNWAGVLLILSLGLVVAARFGPSINGAHRWLRMGPLLIQPSEIMKIVLLFYLASHLARRGRWLATSWAPVKHTAVVVGVTATALLAQPHMSAACLVLGTAALMVILAGLPLRRVVTLVILLAISVFILYGVAPPEQKNRVKAWLGVVPSQEEEYQKNQSRKALERGGLVGVGFCEGRQKMLYLPASHNDFVFSCIAEEFGYLGVVLTFILLGTLVWRCFDVAHHASTQFGSLLSSGIGSMVGLQCLAHFGVATGLLPTTGVTLPFFSAGGSALVCTLVALGLVLNVSRGTLCQDEVRHDAPDSGRRRYRRSSLPPAGVGRYGAPAQS